MAEKKEKLVKINIGCRNRPLPTYINVDIDPTNELADVVDDGLTLSTFKDGSADLIESVHMLEHLSLSGYKQALLVWFSKLKPGGVVRISVPDMEKFSALLLLTGDKSLVASGFYGSQLDEWDFHRSLHTRKGLSADLECSGFTNIREWDWRTTFPHNYVDSFASAYFPHFRKNFIMDNGKGVDLGGVCMSLNLEATKPA